MYYGYYHTGDTISFFEKSVYISDIFWHNPVKYLKVVFLNSYDQAFLFAMHDQAYNIPRTIFFAKILSVLNLITNNNYWLNSIYLSLFSFAASWKLVYELQKLNLGNSTAVVVSFLFVPSVVFWSSGVLKESMVLGSIYFLLALAIELSQNDIKNKHFKILCLAIHLALLFHLKYYLFALILPIVLSCILFLKIKRYKLWVRSMAYFVALGLLVWLFTHIYYTLSFEYFMHELVAYHDQMWIYSIHETQKEFISISYSYSLVENPYSFVSAVPSATFYGLFSPLPFQAHYPIQLFAATENILLIILTAWSLSVFLFKPKIHILKLNVLLYIFICAFIFGITTPNWGTLSRYKIVYLPFFVYIITSNLLNKEGKKD